MKELRYSPDQPREPNGEFGFGDESGSSGKSKDKDNSKSFINVLHDWQDQEIGTTAGPKQRADKAARNNDSKNPIVNGIRKETTNGKEFYRGMTIKRNDQSKNSILNWKKGQTVNILPSSFSLDKSIAKDYTGYLDKSVNRGIGITLSISGKAFDGGYAHGIVLGSRSNKDFAEEKEVISGGTFLIDQIVRTDTSLKIKLTQTGVY